MDDTGMTGGPFPGGRRHGRGGGRDRLGRMAGPGGWGGPGGGGRDRLGRMEGPGGWGGGGRRRLRRGDIRRAILSALRDGAAHGYEVMRRLEDRTGGIWRPSPGSVYPTLQMLEDEGLVRSEARDGTRTYELTDAGRAEAEAGVDDERSVPWAFTEGADRVRTLRTSLVQVQLAARQLGAAGSQEQVDRGLEILDRARRELYQVLAEG